MILIFNQNLFALISDITNGELSKPYLSLIKNQIDVLENEHEVLKRCYFLSEEILPCFFTTREYINKQQYFSYMQQTRQADFLKKCKDICSKNISIEDLKKDYDAQIKVAKDKYENESNISPIQDLFLGDIFTVTNNKNLKIIEHFYNKFTESNIYIVNADAPEGLFNKLVIYTNTDNKVFEVVKFSVYIKEHKQFEDFRITIYKALKDKYLNFDIKNFNLGLYQIAHAEVGDIYSIEPAQMDFYLKLLEIPPRKKLDSVQLRLNSSLNDDEEYFTHSATNFSSPLDTYTLENDFNFIRIDKGTRNFLIIRYVNKKLLTAVKDKINKKIKEEKNQQELSDKNKIQKGL